MRYVIIGVGVAGIEAAKTIRKEQPAAEILMISKDTQVHSRCMLHKYISGERDEKALDFTEENFFGIYGITWKNGVEVTRVYPERKEIVLCNGEYLSYDKLLLAGGADSFIPPIGELRSASNVFGLRNLSDAQAIVREADQGERALVIGSGLVGLDAAYGLMERGKQVTVVEMASQILPIQLDGHSAAEYQRLFEQAGVRFCLGRRASGAVCKADGRIHKVILDDGEAIDCDMIIAAAGVRPALRCLEGTSIACDRGLTVDRYMRTNAEAVYGAGDITGLSGIWPNAADQGRIAGKNMCGIKTEYTDTFAAKNTINFFGLVTLCVGRFETKEGDEISVCEDKNQYLRVIVNQGKVEGALLQGNISNAGIWQYLIKNNVFVGDKRENIFQISYVDFYSTVENGKYEWNTKKTKIF